MYFRKTPLWGCLGILEKTMVEIITKLPGDRHKQAFYVFITMLMTIQYTTLYMLFLQTRHPQNQSGDALGKRCIK